MSMTRDQVPTVALRRRPSWAGLSVVFAALAAGCGGADIQNEQTTGGRALSFAYFQRCVNPVFLAQLPIVGTNTTNTCASSGCHEDRNGTGGAFRVIPSAATVDLANAANTPDAVKITDMYKNFLSAQGEVTFNAIPLSRLITKPRVQGVLHGGGLIFETDLDPNVRVLLYWMTNPVPTGQDEFSSDPGAGACPTQ
jgi:hypothetical protein